MAQPAPIATAMSNLKEDELKRLVDEQLGAGVPPSEVLSQCRAGLALIGERFEKGEYFISELMYAGEMMKDLMVLLEPGLKELAQQKGQAGTIVIGTVRGDIHDIGKDVVALMLRGSGYDVIDLGVDVSPQTFVEAVREHRPFLLGMSVFLTTCSKAITATVEALAEAGLRDQLSIVIGGAAASALVSDRCACDGFGANAVEAVRLAETTASR